MLSKSTLHRQQTILDRDKLPQLKKYCSVLEQRIAKVRGAFQVPSIPTIPEKALRLRDALTQEMCASQLTRRVFAQWKLGNLFTTLDEPSEPEGQGSSEEHESTEE